MQLGTVYRLKRFAEVAEWKGDIGSLEADYAKRILKGIWGNQDDLNCEGKVEWIQTKRKL